MTNRTQYYEEMKSLACKTRAAHGIRSLRVLRSDMRRVFRALGVRVDLWPHKFKMVRGAYFNDSSGPTVMLSKGLPPDPMIFTMAHELKHHLADRDTGLCLSGEQKDVREIGAEVFAAEFLFPEQEFGDLLRKAGVSRSNFTPEALVRLKHETRTSLSYSGLAKRAIFLGFASAGSLDKIKWKTLEYGLYGEPLHRRLWRVRRTSP